MDGGEDTEREAVELSESVAELSKMVSVPVGEFFRRHMLIFPRSFSSRIAVEGAPLEGR